MAEVVTTNERPIVGYAQPLSRLQVSWGSILAGAITTLAVGLILWMLAMAIIWTALKPSAEAVGDGLIAAWITGIACTLVGAFAGGLVAGYLPGNPRRLITVTHGLLSWCAAFLITFAVQLAVLSGVARTATYAAVSTTAAALQATGEAVGGAAQGQEDLRTQAVEMFMAMGYSQPEAERMVTQALGMVPGGLTERQQAEAKAQATQAVDRFFNGAALFTWITFGTWAVAAFMSALGALSVIRRVRLVAQKERAREDEERLLISPLVIPASAEGHT